MPIVSFVDTPGFMVGPDSEKEGAVRRMSNLFKSGSKVGFASRSHLKKRIWSWSSSARGRRFAKPAFTAAWPTGEFGGMGLEGAVKLGFKKS